LQSLQTRFLIGVQGADLVQNTWATPPMLCLQGLQTELLMEAQIPGQRECLDNTTKSLLAEPANKAGGASPDTPCGNIGPCLTESRLLHQAGLMLMVERWVDDVDPIPGGV
jgi:hypothetical protein